MHELQEEYLMVVKYDVKSYGDLFRLKLRLQDRYELFDRIYEEGVREKNYKKYRNSR